MSGNFTGNLIGTGYFLGYQIIGLLLSFFIWKRENYIVRILLGSVFGSLLLQWMPALFSFAMGFNRGSHIASLICAAVLAGGICFFVW